MSRWDDDPDDLLGEPIEEDDDLADFKGLVLPPRRMPPAAIDMDGIAAERAFGRVLGLVDAMDPLLRTVYSGDAACRQALALAAIKGERAGAFDLLAGLWDLERGQIDPATPAPWLPGCFAASDPALAPAARGGLQAELAGQVWRRLMQSGAGTTSDRASPIARAAAFAELEAAAASGVGAVDRRLAAFLHQAALVDGLDVAALPRQTAILDSQGKVAVSYRTAGAAPRGETAAALAPFALASVGATVGQILMPFGQAPVILPVATWLKDCLAVPLGAAAMVLPRFEREVSRLLPRSMTAEAKRIAKIAALVTDWRMAAASRRRDSSLMRLFALIAARPVLTAWAVANRLQLSPRGARLLLEDAVRLGVLCVDERRYGRLYWSPPLLGSP